jgi:hypothetical protein
MTPEVMKVDTDVLVIGSGAAGMYAAIEAARRGAEVFLIDRSLIGRGGATVMAQMTVAVALGAETPDHWSHHLDDTLKAGAACATNGSRSCSARKGPSASSKWRNGASAGPATATSPRHGARHGRPRCVCRLLNLARPCRARCAPWSRRRVQLAGDLGSSICSGMTARSWRMRAASAKRRPLPSRRRPPSWRPAV